MKAKIILLGGKTGGPIIPLLAIAKNLPGTEPIIYGVNNSFEQNIAYERGFRFVRFPESKLRLLTFSRTTTHEKLEHLYDFVRSGVLFLFSMTKGMIMLLRDRPKIIFSSGSFLAVPIIFANSILRFLRLSSTKVVIHQQDPQPGLSNKLTISMGDIVSCVFDSTRQYKGFSKAEIIPNPFDFDSIKPEYIAEIEQKMRKSNPELVQFVLKASKPLMLIFGGGSGSDFINNWVGQNRMELTKRFCVLHLTGTYRQKTSNLNSKEYFSHDFLLEGMQFVMYHADVVVSRCGMGTITELQNLGKPGFLIPLPDSHQEQNAIAVQDTFVILYQNDAVKWLETIERAYPAEFEKKYSRDIIAVKETLDRYYSKLNDLLR